jgi:RHS repeat-associated protein
LLYENANPLPSYYYHSTGYIDAGNNLRYYELRDQLGNIRTVVGETGNVVEQNDFYAYGAVRQTWRSAGDGRWKFLGKELDTETQSTHLEAREFGNLEGVFNKPDRFEHQYPDLSPYSYAAQNPLRKSDESGDTIKINTQNAPEGFEKRTQEYLNQLKKDDPNLKKMVEALEKSPEIHEISYREGEALSFSQNDIKEKNNQPTGSFIIFDPYSYSRSDIAHELSHAYDTDQGKTSKESIKSIQGVLIPKREVDAVNVENLARKATGQERRNTYTIEKSDNIFIKATIPKRYLVNPTIRPIKR